MIDYQNFSLKNGLRVYVHEDHSVPLANMNILYDVGAKDEQEHKTGFAHLFEHLMFGGSQHIPQYDLPLQQVGGENNAFTSNDITNYYLTLPAANLETGFWLESDRMMALSFKEESLEVQRKVVIEEFKQRYLNQPYGDVWLKLRPLAYKVHPYRWATIGKDISHIENATLDDVKDFFYKYYLPNNAILVVSGNVRTLEVQKLCEKWFEPIPAGKRPLRSLPKEPTQTEARFEEIVADVPVNAIYKAYHCCEKKSEKFYATDILSEILGNGKSSRLYENLVKNKQMFSSLNAYLTGSMDNGLFCISGKLNEGVDFLQAEKAIEQEIKHLQDHRTSEDELQKIKNQAEATLAFSEVDLLNRSMNLAFSALLGDASMVNKQMDKIQKVNTDSVQKVAQEILNPENCSTIYYRKK